jgi:hypothetical protein
MHSDEFLTAIKADRERQIKAAQRAHLVDRNVAEDDKPGGSPSDARSLTRFLRRAPQSGRASVDPSV